MMVMKKLARKPSKKYLETANTKKPLKAERKVK